MTPRLSIFLLMINSVAFSQTAGISLAGDPQPPKQPPPRGTVLGKVELEGNGKPLEGIQIQLTLPPSQNQTVLTNPNGIYQFQNVTPGRYRVRAARQDSRGVLGAPEQKYITVAANTDTKVDFKMPPLAEISGKIVDANREPVPNVRVSLLHIMTGPGDPSRIYINTHMSTSTNDLGEYAIAGIEPGHPFMVYAEAPPSVSAASASTPTDPDLRRPLRAPTFYPSSLTPEGGQAVTLGKGEVRTNVDIEMVRTRSYCIESAVPPTPEITPMAVTVDANEPASGAYSDTLRFRPGNRFLVDPSGKIRICGLSPADYHMFVQPARPLANGVAPPPGSREFYATARFTITNQDLPPIALNEQPLVDVPVEVAWDGTAPAQPPAQNLNFSFGPAGGSATAGRGVQAKIPGTAVMEKLRSDMYVFFVRNVPPASYVKAITYGGQPLPRPFIPGNKGGEKPLLKVTLGLDGGSVVAHVADKDGPMAGYPVLLIPETVSSQADISTSVVSCYTEDDGACRSWSTGTTIAAYVTQILAPGKYRMLATQLSYTPSADEIDKLWRSLSKATAVDLAPGATAEVTVTPVLIQ